MTLLPIKIPQGASVKVSVGEKIAAGMIIAEIKAPKSEHVIHLTSDFKIPLKKIKGSLKKNLGDSVNEGDTIAEKSQAFGITSVEIISQFSGILAKIDEETGDIYIKTIGEGEKGEPIISPVEGTVEICNNEKIVIKSQAEAFVAEDSLGEDAQGEILYIEDFDTEKLSSKISGKIVLVKDLDKVSLFKIMGLDASGVMTLEINDADFIDLSEKKIKTPVMNITDEDFKKLALKNGEKVILDGRNKSIIVL